MSKPSPSEIKLSEKLRKLKAQHEFAVQNLNDQIATLKSELENERTAIRSQTRNHRTYVKQVRDDEHKKCQSLVEQIRAQLNLKFKEEIEKEKRRLTEKYEIKKKSSTASRISKIFKVGDPTAAKSKTSHVKELVRRLNGLQTGPSCNAAGINKCVTKTPNASNNQIMSSQTTPSLSSVPGVPSGKLIETGTDTESVTEDPIVPQIIVPKPECDLDNLPDDSVTEDGLIEENSSVINSWTKGVGLETLYTLLSSAHLELQRAHLILQSNLRKEQRTRKHLEEKVRYLNTLMSQKSKQQPLINPINASLSAQLDQCKEREGKLLEQLQELHDQNELLEFRVLELEQCSGVPSEHALVKRTISRTPDTDISDSGVISLSPSEDIYCSDSDLHDKLETTTSTMGGDVKERLSLLCQNLDNVSERIIVQQAINLLRHYETRISGMEATVSNMCQEVAMCRSMNSSLEDPPSPSECRKSTRIIATVLPFTGHPSSQVDDARPFSSLPNPIRDDDDLMTVESPFRKMFRENESMQESGIYFEDEDLGFHCQSTQTDSGNQSRLSEELRKLAQIREKLEREQEKERCFKPIIKQDKSKAMCSRQELEYYKEEMERLEKRLALYESCGEEQNTRLQAMLERDEILKKQLHRLEEDNEKLRRENEFLDMEKCEYEELENDTRLQCQRLEVKLNCLNEKKLELQSQVSHNIRLIASLQSNIEANDKFKSEARRQLDEAHEKIQSLETTISCYETSLNKCEQKNFELEEKEIELKDRIHLLEAALPVLIGYHVYKAVERCRDYCMWMRSHCTSPSNESTSCDTTPSKAEAQPYLPLCYSLDKSNAPTVHNLPLPLTNTSHTSVLTEKHHVETQTLFDNIIRRTTPLDKGINQTIVDKNVNNAESISRVSERNVQTCENCKNNNSVLTLNKEAIAELNRISNEKVDELNRMIKDLKIKEKLYEQTMSEADEMFSNMTLEYRVQIENLENQINANAAEMRVIKKELDKEREENDRVNSVQAELMKEMKMKEGEKKQLNSKLECLRMQLEEEREESLKFKQEIASFKKLFDTEKSKCKDLEVDLKEANIEIKELENRVESKMKSYEKEIDKLCKKLEDLAVTNGELKEEVDTLENVVKELKLALTHERYKRDSIKTELSAELQARTRELTELRSTMQGAGLKSTAQEIEEALASMEYQPEDDGCHLSITEIPDQLEKLTEKLAKSQDHTKTCESCKSNLSVTVQELMDQISTMKTSAICQGPHSEEVYKLATLPRVKPTPLESNHPSSTTDLKCKEKDVLIYNLAYELKQLADRNLWVRYPALVDNLRKQISECPDFTRAVLVQYLNGKLVMTPKFLDKSLLDLRIIKAVGYNSLLIAWKPPPLHCSVEEFLVYINGEFLRKIYAEQGRALLHPVDIQKLSKPIQVTLMSADAKYPSASAYYC